MENPSGGKKIGIIGGTFDPVHYGHLLIAENAACQLGLDEVRFLPAGCPPHKKSAGVSDARYRLDMLKLAIRGNPGFVLETSEIEKKETSYTYLTLSELGNQYPQDRFYFIMGADSLFEFETWKHPKIICEKAALLAAVRGSVDEAALCEKIEDLKKKFDAEIYALRTPNFSISSSDIRARTKSGMSTRYLLPEEVRMYIAKEKLYL